MPKSAHPILTVSESNLDSSTIRVERILPGAYEIDADCLRAFEKIISKHLYCLPTCELFLENGRSSELHSIDDMLDETFLHSTYISSITLSGKNANLRVHVEFRRSFLKPVSYRLVGQKWAVAPIEADIENMVQRPMRWYGFLKSPFGKHHITAFLIAWVGLATLSTIAFQVGWTLAGSPPNAKILIVCSGLCSAILGWMILPSMIFSIGREEKRRAVLNKVASFLFISVGTAAVVTWVTALYNPLSP